MLEYQLTHGECVALGMMGALRIAVDQRLVEAELLDTLRYALGKFGLPSSLSRKIDSNLLMAIMLGDKKSAASKTRFVLPTKLGEVTTRVEVEDIAVEQAIDKLHTL